MALAAGFPWFGSGDQLVNTGIVGGEVLGGEAPRSMIVLGIGAAFGTGLRRQLGRAQLERTSLFESSVPALLHALLPETKALERVMVPDGAGVRVPPMADDFDVDALIERFRERAKAVRSRGVPPVEGPDRKRFIEQAKVDFMDYAMLGDAEGSLADGVLTLRIDLRPKPE